MIPISFFCNLSSPAKAYSEDQVYLKMCARTYDDRKGSGNDFTSSIHLYHG